VSDATGVSSTSASVVPAGIVTSRHVEGAVLSFGVADVVGAFVGSAELSVVGAVPDVAPVPLTAS
jgi:hypothetical protein